MDVMEAMRIRQTIRKYKSTPLPKSVIKEVITSAIRAPSAMNIQPWEFVILAGDVLDDIRKANVEKYSSDHLELKAPVLHGVYRARQVQIAAKLFNAMGIARGDQEKRAWWTLRGYRYFDAPAVIIVCMDKSLDNKMVFDLGLVTQSICLAALNLGLGTAIMDQGIVFPDIIRKFTHIPESTDFITSIAIGYPEPDFPANKVISDRENVENITTWFGFE